MTLSYLIWTNHGYTRDMLTGGFVRFMTTPNSEQMASLIFIRESIEGLTHKSYHDKIYHWEEDYGHCLSVFMDELESDYRTDPYGALEI